MLASKNLPAAIEDIGGNQVPESIRSKSQGMREQGGIEALEEQIHSLPELLQRNREILDEVLSPFHCIFKIIVWLDSTNFG